MPQTFPTRCWVVIPSAGSSRRMGDGATPKQYQSLAGRTVIEWSLAPFLLQSSCSKIVVVLSSQDAYWGRLRLASNNRIETTIGGAERVHSVLAGLDALAQWAEPRDWVLVHDAARPCLSSDDLERLMLKVWTDEVGGLLATPLVDTLKRADGADRVLETVSRDLLWRAFTPQMFRYELLRRALALAIDNNVAVTDEAQSIEALGFHPKLIAGDADNIKITVPADLLRAERILQARGQAVGS